MKQSHIEMITKQTSFLLGKQQETKTFYEEEYDAFLTFVDQTFEEITDESRQADRDALQHIKEVISEQKDELLAQIADDVLFLEEQLKSIEYIAAIADPVKQQEFKDMLFDEGQELLETDEFMHEVEQEASSCQKNLSAMLRDFTDTIAQGEIQEVVLLLDALVDEQQEDMDAADNDADEDIEYVDEGADEKEGVDIFSFLNGAGCKGGESMDDMRKEGCCQGGSCGNNEGCCKEDDNKTCKCGKENCNCNKRPESSCGSGSCGN